MPCSCCSCLCACTAQRPLSYDPAIAPSLVFKMSDGAALPARSWLPPAGVAWRGVILALHGFTDSRDGWELPAPVFAQAGYAVFAPDQRGFGGTADRGRWVGSGAAWSMMRGRCWRSCARATQDGLWL